MPTPLDEFVLEVGLDPEKFSEGRRALDDEIGKGRKTLETFGKEVERHGQKISEIFGLTKRGVAGILATFVGAEGAAFVDRVAQMDAHTSRLAHSIGISTRELSVWQNMVRMVGGTAEDASATFAGLTDTFQQMMMGNVMPSAGFASLLSRAGVDWRRATPNQALQQIMGFLGGQPERQQRFWLSQIPGMNESMMFLMLEGIKNMGKFREEIERVGVASEESGEQARDLQQKTGELQTAWENFSRVLFPTLTAILNFVTGITTSKVGGLFASMLAGATVGAGVGSVVPGVGTAVGAVAGAAAGAATWESYQFGAGAPAPGVSRGDRNNNPGNIKWGPFAQSQGATGQDAGGFAVFPTWRTGAAAMAQLLHNAYQGLTLAQIQQRWVGNTDKGYLAQMMSATGLKAGDVPNLNDPNVVAALIRGMMRGEGTHLIQGDKAGTVNKSSSLSVGSINVTSNRADPAAVAQEVPDALKRYSMLAGANSGLV